MNADHEIVMFDSPAAAQPHSMQGWLSRGGHFYMDEGAARYDGCTHRPCDVCGAPTSKHYTCCKSCREKAELARYESRPEAPWDGVAMVYSEARDEYYSSPDDAEDSLEDDENVASLRLVLCVPQYTPILEPDYFADELPEDGEAPDVLLDAIDAFNAAVKGVVLSWVPGRFALAGGE